MSVLTKIFVVSLVVLSLLLSAMAITFANSVDDYGQLLASAKLDVANANAAKAAAEATAAADRVSAAATITQLTQQKDALQTAVTTANADAEKAKTDLAAANAAAQTASLNVTKLTAAASAMEASRGELSTQLASLRDENTKLQTQNGQLNVALTDMTEKFNVTEAARKDAAEQLAQMKSENDKMGGALRDLGKDPNAVTGGVAAGAPPINGVIREVRAINNMPHAQISVGSDDGVKKDMQFSVLDATTGRFLGRLTIVAVEPNAAIGRLEGPNVATIAAGAEVRTQL